jgi:5'-nucleotidase
VVTFGEAFAVQPFGNLDTSMDMTGAQIYTLLEQQWPNADRVQRPGSCRSATASPTGGTPPLALHSSATG